MFKSCLLTLVLLITLLITSQAHALSPTGSGVFIVSNCNQITFPVANKSYCLVGNTMSVWNGSAWVSAGSFPLTNDVSGNGFNITNTNLPNSSVNHVLNVMASPYKCKGNGITDDTACIQQAIWDATTGGVPFGTCTTTMHNPVYLPPPPVCYAHSAPIRKTCPSFEFYGNSGSSALCNVGYDGPAVIEEGAVTVGLPYATSLVSGPGNSLVSASGPTHIFIDLARHVNTIDALLNHIFASSFNIAFFMKPTNFIGDQVLSSAGAYPGTFAGAFKFAMGGGNQVFVAINTISAVAHNFAGCPAQTASTVYELELDWDGTTYRVWQGVPGGTAVLCDSWVSSSGLQPSGFEEMLLPDGAPTQFWPDGSSAEGNAFNGDIDSVRFERTSVHIAAYTVPTTKFTGDTNTWLVENFEASFNGTQIGHAALGTSSALIPVYFEIWGATAGGTQGSNMHDLELCSNGLGAGRHDNRASSGLYSINAVGSKWTNVSCSNVNYVGADFVGDYYSVLDHWNSFGGWIGLDFNSAWNQSVNRNAGIDGTFLACAVNQGGGGGSHEDYSSRCVDRGFLSYGWIENQSSGNYYYPAIDQEVSNPYFKANILLNDPSGVYNFVGADLSPGSTGVDVQQDNGGFGANFIGPTFNPFGTTPEVIDFTNGTPTIPIQLINPSLPVGIPVSNLPLSVKVADNGTYGAINILDAGAKCDGSTDDTTVINAAIQTSTASVPVRSLFFPWTGHLCKVTQLNLANLGNGFRLIGQTAPMSGADGSGIDCVESAPNTGNCIDALGSWYYSIENMTIRGDATNSPNVLLLMGKSSLSGNPGNSQTITLSGNTFINTAGHYVVYDYGAEILRALNNQFVGGTTANIVIGGENTAGITSSFATFQTPPASMTTSEWRDNIYSCPGSNNCILLDTGASTVANINNLDFDGGYAKHTGAGFIDSVGNASLISGLDIKNIRDEPQGASTTQYFAKFAAQVENFNITGDTFANTVQPSVAILQFNRGSVSSAVAGYINIRPGDTQATYPTTNTITCTAGTTGVTFYSADASGGVPLSSACSGLLTCYKGGCNDLNKYAGSGSNVIPACGTTIPNGELWVSDGVTGCTYGSTYSAGAGTSTCKVGCNGTNWLYGY